MTSGARLNTVVSRRQIMSGAAGLTFALALDAGKLADAAASDSDATPRTFNPWVTIAPDGTVSIMSAAAEMGQGSMTSLPLVLAEELDADWDKVRVLPAPVIERIYGNPAFGGAMYTAGSTAVTAYFEPLRTFGAQVRRVCSRTPPIGGECL
jgi:isoquinoline 1-oxidoreductase beta subunit